MKTNNSNGNKSRNKENTFLGKLDKKRINTIAHFSGFIKRKSDKIKPVFLIFGFYKMITKNLNTYEDWSSEIAILSGKPLSRQAVEERMTVKAASMIQLVFKEKLNSVLSEKTRLKDNELFRKFSAIKIDDSTILNLPEQLNQFFPGNVCNGKKKAQMKIHALYDFTDNSFSLLNVHNYTDSDQGLAGNVLPYLNAGDLILRDLGFQNLTIQKELIQKEIYFVSKKSPAVNVFDIQTGQEILLLRYLRKKGCFDGDVWVGSKEKVQMRMIIMPLSKEVAAERRRRIKKNQKLRFNYSKEYYELLGYSILLTNISKEICSRQQIGKLYGLRWRIETIFKSWKSHFSLEKVMPLRCNNPERIYCIIYLMLLFIILFQSVWLKKLVLRDLKTGGQAHLSLLKLSKFFKQHFTTIAAGENKQSLMTQLEKQCKYDIRYDKKNTMEKYYKLAA
jgi:hypothetical protein